MCALNILLGLLAVLQRCNSHSAARVIKQYHPSHAFARKAFEDMLAGNIAIGDHFFAQHGCSRIANFLQSSSACIPGCGHTELPGIYFGLIM